MSKPTDTELMTCVRDGDVRRLAPLYERHRDRLYNFYVRMTGDRDASEDMVQEVFFRMLKYRHTFRGEGEFTAWMYHLARNVRLDNHRKQKGGPATDQDVDALASDDPHPQDRMEREEETDLLRRALARMAAERREILILSRYQDLRYDAIAVILGCSVEAVRVRVHRAMNELRTIYFTLSGGQGDE